MVRLYFILTSVPAPPWFSASWSPNWPKTVRGQCLHSLPAMKLSIMRNHMLIATLSTDSGTFTSRLTQEILQLGYIARCRTLAYHSQMSRHILEHTDYFSISETWIAKWHLRATLLLSKPQDPKWFPCSHCSCQAMLHLVAKGTTRK